MKVRMIRHQLGFAIGLALIAAGASAAPGYVKLGKTGADVLEECNPTNSGTVTTCKVSSLPGESGYTLVGSRSTPLVKNGVTVGTLYDRVWRNDTHPKRYIFGLQVVMNSSRWDPSGLSFNVNDLARRLRPHAFAQAAYYLDTSTKALIAAGRTSFGLNEYDGEQPERDNSWVDFRVDANAAEPSGISSAASPWVLVKTRAPQGYEVAPFGARVLNSDFEFPSSAVEVFVSSYQPIGVPENEEEEDDGDND